MKRGDIVIASAPGDYGEPRPAAIVQSNLFNDTHTSILVCLLTSDLQDAPIFRITVEPDKENGLNTPSQIMVGNMLALRRESIGKQVGKISDEILVQLKRSLALFIRLAQ